MKEPDHLFVYGTLKKGFENELALYLNQTQSYEGSAWFPGLLFQVSFYPGAVYIPEEKKKVYGDLYRLIEDKTGLLARLDHYEGYGAAYPRPNEFTREIIPVHSRGSTLQAYTYLFNKSYSEYPLIESGEFSGKEL